MSQRVLKELGFSRVSHVQGRASIADLFKPHERCGIYVLHFTNAEFYAGQAVDVTRRYVQHRKTHKDIQKIAFKRAPQNKLNSEERTVIERLEQNGWPLRNITFTSIPKGESDFDLIMPREEQERWLHDFDYVDDGGDRLVDPDLRRRYRGRFQNFLKTPHADEVFDVLRTYVRAGIPAIRRGEVSFWSCSCLPTDNVYSRVNIYWQVVFTISTFDNDLWFSFHLALSPLKKVFGDPLLPLLVRHPRLKYGGRRYVPGGSDQTSFMVRGAEAAKAFVLDRNALPAIRLFNLRLMQRGPCTYGRYHCMDLVDRLVVVDSDNYS
jgi:hypothetical protein